MALQIYLEAKSVGGTSLNIWGHYYLVLRDDTLPTGHPDNEKVIRGGDSGGILSIQADILLSESHDAYGDSAVLRPSINITDLLLSGIVASHQNSGIGLRYGGGRVPVLV